MSALEVVAFEVEALSTNALIEEVALIVPTLINPAVSVEIIEDIELKRVAKRFVEVALVSVALELFKLVNVPVVPVI